MAHPAYLTHTEYKKLGGTLPRFDFTRMEFKCRKRIDYLTDSRVQAMKEIPEAVKLCMMSLIAVEYSAGAEAQAQNPTVTSFSTDGYSESYGNALSASEAAASMDGTIRTMLYGEYDDNGVPLLYRGVGGY